MNDLSRAAREVNRNLPRKMKLPPVKEIETQAAPSGNGAHVFVPKDWAGKRVKVILLD